MEKQPERKLIHDNVAMYNAIAGDLNKYMPSLRLLKQAYDALEIGDFNDAIFSDIKKNGIEKILLDFDKNLQSQLDKSGIKNSNLRRVALEGSETAKANLTNAYEALKTVTIDIPAYGVQRSKTLDLKDISFIDGTFKIADPEQVKEQFCRVYLEDQDDHYIFNVLVHLRNSLNNFSVMAKKFGFGFALSDSGLQHFFKINEDGEISINPYSINNAKMKLPTIKAYNDRQQAMADRRNEQAKKEREQNEREQEEIASVMYTKVSQD